MSSMRHESDLALREDSLTRATTDRVQLCKPAVKQPRGTSDEKVYDFSVSIERGRYHMVGVVREACCAGVTGYNSSGDFAALYSQTTGWNRHRGSVCQWLSIVREMVDGHLGWSSTDHACPRAARTFLVRCLGMRRGMALGCTSSRTRSTGAVGVRRHRTQV